MQTRPSTPSRSALVRRGLDHPILDSDGHHVEYQPAVFDILARVAGSAMVDRYRKWVEENSLFAWYAMSPAEREDARILLVVLDARSPGRAGRHRPDPEVRR